MMAFVLDCHPEISQIRQLNPGLSAVRDLPEIKYHRLSDSMQQANHNAHSASSDAATDSKAVPVRKQQTRALSLEDTKREARENWRRTYYDTRADQLGPQADSIHEKNDAEMESTQPERDAGIDFDPDR